MSTLTDTFGSKVVDLQYDHYLLSEKSLCSMDAGFNITYTSTVYSLIAQELNTNGTISGSI
jgi:hypothetical protein